MSAFLPAKLHINYGRKKIYGEKLLAAPWKS